MVDISIITLNYKEPVFTKKCIDTLLKSKKISLEIILVSNSNDSKDKKVFSKISDKRVRLFIMDKNLGCADGYNFGIKKSKGKYVFILNNDTEIKDGLGLFKMKKFMDKNPKVAVLQPKIKSFSKPKYFEYAGAAGGYIDILGYPFCRGRIFQDIEKDDGQFNDVVDVSWASTCAFFARKNILLKAGLFDTIYFAYAEEVDLSLKIWNLGYRVVFFPNTEIFHKGEVSWKKIRGRKTYFIHRNHLILFFKCFPIKYVLMSLPQRLLLEPVAMIHYATNRSLFHIFFVLLSNFSAFWLLPHIFYKRRAFFKDYRKNNNPIYTKSIVLEYFLNKKRYFNDLDKERFKIGL